MASQIARFAVKSTRNAFDQPKVLQAPVRNMSGANPKIKAQQEHFLKEDGNPVHIKGGALDQVLYRSTVGLCIVSIGLFAYNMIGMAGAKK